MATMPARLESLEHSVASLLPQVDRIHVALNGHVEVPAFLQHPKVTATLCDNSLGDGGKFMGLPADGWIFTCDDDLIYPPDYVETMIDGATRHGCIVTLHGRIFTERPILSYYKSPSTKYRCLDDVAELVEVEVGGTGVMCWNAMVFSFGPEDIEAPNMSDLFVSRKAKREGVPIMVLPHAAGWLKHNIHLETIYRTHHRNDAVQTAVYNGEWSSPPAPLRGRGE